MAGSKRDHQALEELSHNHNGSNNASQIDVNDSMVLVASGNLVTNQRRSDVDCRQSRINENAISESGAKVRKGNTYLEPALESVGQTIRMPDESHSSSLAAENHGKSEIQWKYINPGKGSPAEVKPRREEKAIPSVLEWVHEYHCMIDVRQDNTRQILPHLTLHLAESDFGSSMTTEVWYYAQGKPNKNGILELVLTMRPQ
ncbi:hypothetical protein R3P38DRAFT_2814009 [Favolaschia claudopus]|uniref:Uncharacterized protein n=1 Tax=Favolaschia claudopus TaxID=2862362 RepID=A0AAV9Z424_9AGAR